MEHLGRRLRLGRNFLVQQRNGRAAQIRHDYRLVAAPVFAWLNYRLVKGDKRHKLTMGMNFLAIIGLIYLTGFTVLFLLNQTGILLRLNKHI